MNDELVTFTEWRHQHPEKWARVEGTVTSSQLRTLKFLDAQIHITRHLRTGATLPESIEVRWIQACIHIYLHVRTHLIYPKDQKSVMWVKNQRRGTLCDYQVASVLQIPDWQWNPRRSTWNERANHLDQFRNEYGRDPRVRSGWKYERALAHWQQRQRAATVHGKLTPTQVAILDGDRSVPTSELTFRIPTFAGSYETWFRDFWSETVHLKLDAHTEASYEQTVEINLNLANRTANQCQAGQRSTAH